MRVTKEWLVDTRRLLVESQARLCAIAGAGYDALVAEHKRVHPHYVGHISDNPTELLRQLLYNDLLRIIPHSLTDGR